MKKRDQANLDAASSDELVEEITVDANGEDEQLWAFRQAFEDNVSLPCEATIIGEPVKVMPPAGYTVYQVRNGKEALRKVQSVRPDSYRGKQSAAESCAKYLGSFIAHGGNFTANEAPE